MRSLLEKLLLGWLGLLNTLLELGDTSTGIEDALLAGIEGVADRADFNE